MKNREEELILEFSAAKVAELGAFIVDVKVDPNKVLIELDKMGGITISECTQLSKHLTNEPLLNALFEKHELEVGSPGMGNPFRVYAQYQKNMGRNVKVKTIDGEAFTGKLEAVNEKEIELLQTPIKKKEESKKVKIAFDQIIETRIIITF